MGLGPTVTTLFTASGHPKCRVSATNPAWFSPSASRSMLQVDSAGVCSSACRSRHPLVDGRDTVERTHGQVISAHTVTIRVVAVKRYTGQGPSTSVVCQEHGAQCDLILPG